MEKYLVNVIFNITSKEFSQTFQYKIEKKKVWKIVRQENQNLKFQVKCLKIFLNVRTNTSVPKIVWNNALKITGLKFSLDKKAMSQIRLKNTTLRLIWVTYISVKYQMWSFISQFIIIRTWWWLCWSETMLIIV